MKRKLSLIMVGVLVVALFSSAFAQKTELTLMRFLATALTSTVKIRTLRLPPGSVVSFRHLPTLLTHKVKP